MGLKGTMTISPFPARWHQCPGSSMVDMEHTPATADSVHLLSHQLQHLTPESDNSALCALCISKVERGEKFHSVHSIFLPLYIC